MRNQDYFYPSALNEVGEVIFSGGVDPLSPSTAISGIWHGRPGELTLVAKESGSAPDSSGGSLAFGGIFGFPQLNDQGEAAFAGDLVDPQGDVAIWSGAVSDLSLVARPGAEAPGTGGEPFQEVLSLFGSNPLEIANPDSLALNALGEVAFLGLESGLARAATASITEFGPVAARPPCLWLPVARNKEPSLRIPAASHSRSSPRPI